VSDRIEQQMRMWVPQREQREKIGDRLDQPRELDHFSYFRRRKAAEAAAGELAALGFRVSVSRRGLKHGVEASRDDVLTDDGLRAILTEVIGVVSSHGGEYDGFGGTIVQ